MRASDDSQTTPPSSFDDQGRGGAAARHSPPRFARWPVLIIAAASALLLVSGSGADNYFFDELYFLSAGKYHLSWGYADQPPLVPLLARAMDYLFPNSVVGLRLPTALVTAGGVIIAALIAREFDGRRRAQVMAAGAYAMSFQVAVISHWLVTYTIDPFWWTLITFLLVHWVRLRQHDSVARAHDWPLLASGVVTAFALQTKFLIPLLWVPIGISALAVGPRELLRRPMLWAGAAIAVVATLPGLFWQARHGWPQLEMSRVVAREADLQGGRLALLPGAVTSAGIVVGAALFCYGVWQLSHSKELRPYRFLGWTVLGVLTLLIIVDGQPRYAAGMYALVFAAGAAVFERRSADPTSQPKKWWRWALTWPSFAVSALVAVGVFVFSIIAQTPGSAAWPQTAADTAGVYRTLPDNQKDHTALMAEIYPIAAAIDHFGAQYGLPHAYSPHRGYWYFGPPPDRYDTVLFVGDDMSRLRGYFTSVKQVGPTGQSIWLCEGRQDTWSHIWPLLRTT